MPARGTGSSPRRKRKTSSSGSATTASASAAVPGMRPVSMAPIAPALTTIRAAKSASVPTRQI